MFAGTQDGQALILKRSSRPRILGTVSAGGGFQATNNNTTMGVGPNTCPPEDVPAGGCRGEEKGDCGERKGAASTPCQP